MLILGSFQVARTVTDASQALMHNKSRSRTFPSQICPAFKDSIYFVTFLDCVSGLLMNFRTIRSVMPKMLKAILEDVQGGKC